MKAFKVPVESLHEDPANARKHDDKNIAAIKASLARFGQQKPLVVSKNKVVIAGNGTLRAAKELGWTEIAIVETELKGADATAFAIADNRTSELSTWDDDILGKELQALREEGWDLSDLGFFSFDTSGLQTEADMSVFDEASTVENPAQSLEFLFLNEEDFGFVKEYFKDCKSAAERGVKLKNVLQDV